MSHSDKISFLPNEIQDQIVSYLPTEEAIRTSILSTRWRKVCYSLSNFNFHMRRFPRTWPLNVEAFKNYVNQVLVLHDNSDIHKFRLVVVYEDFDASLPTLINQWILFAVDHKVRELRISVVIRESHIFAKGEGITILVVFPPAVFISSSLTVLFISGIRLVLPANIILPNLKDLTFELVQFVDDNDTQRLILSSPLLEQLSILDCFWLNTRDFSTLLLPAPNLKVLKLLNVDHDIQLSTIINLHQIWYKGNSPPHFSMEDVSSVVEATFIFPRISWPSNKVPGHWQSEILLGLANVVKLTLNGWFIEYLSRELDLLSRLPTSCSTLKYLVLDFYPTVEQLKVVILLLRSYPCLQTLHICIEKLPITNLTMLFEMLGIVDFVETRELATEAVLDCLTRVEIDGFEESEIELDLVRALLGNAASLELMNITLSSISQRRGTTSSIVNDKIQMFTRVSPLAIISIMDNGSGR